jgi:hypothetical protein
MKKNIENIAKYMSMTIRLATRSCPTLKIESGTSGARATRASTNTNAPSSRPATASGASTPVDPQPSASVRTIPYVRLTSPAVTSNAPVTSKLRGPSAGASAGSTRRLPAITSAPSGTLIAKIAGHPSVWVSTPPSRAPDEAPSPPTAPHRPSPRLRSRPSGSEEVMIDNVAGETIAPPKPCSARRSAAKALALDLPAVAGLGAQLRGALEPSEASTRRAAAQSHPVRARAADVEPHAAAHQAPTVAAGYR